MCDNLSRSVQLGQPTRDQAVILREVLTLVKQTQAQPRDMRGIGISGKQSYIYAMIRSEQDPNDFCSDPDPT